MPPGKFLARLLFSDYDHTPFITTTHLWAVIAVQGSTAAMFSLMKVQCNATGNYIYCLSKLIAFHRIHKAM